MHLYKTSRIVLRATPDPEKLLEGITSNTLDAPRNAFVDKIGRFASSFDQLRVDKDVLIAVDERLVARLFSHVAPYLKLAPTRLVPERLHVYFDLDSSRTPADDEYVIPKKKGRYSDEEKERMTSTATYEDGGAMGFVLERTNSGRQVSL